MGHLYKNFIHLFFAGGDLENAEKRKEKCLSLSFPSHRGNERSYNVSEASAPRISLGARVKHHPISAVGGVNQEA